MTQLQDLLDDLITNHGLVSLKGGTEWEDMDYGEIAHLFALGRGQLPMLVKVAGPEALADLRHLRDIGIADLLGPMIESEYALEKFVKTAQALYAGSGIRPRLAVNIETIDGYHKLDALLANPAFAQIELVVIGRLDLSLSMHIPDVDHPEVAGVTRDLAARVRAAGKHCSIGGFVNPASAGTFSDYAVDRVSTIHTMFDFGRMPDPRTAIWQAIEFEIAYYDALIEHNPARAAFYKGRIETSLKKLDKARTAGEAA
jgi:hypothetical protein